VGRLEGKTAIVVGAGSIGPGWGNGKATAVTFAREGAQVFCVDRNADAATETVEIITGEGGKALAFAADASRADDITAMVQACLKAYGRIDVLDNNVGIAETGSVVDVAEADWDRVFAVNVRGVFLVTKHAAPLLRKSDDAHIINTNSIVGARPGPQPLPYSVSKGALWTMTKALAGALGPDGIRVNGVAPGWMEGDWMERMLGDNYDKLMERRAKQTPLRRCVTAEDVADAVMSLIRGSKGVSGMILTVDGGFAAVT